jgi:hypothetical protein
MDMFVLDAETKALACASLAWTATLIQAMSTKTHVDLVLRVSLALVSQGYVEAHLLEHAW